MNLLHIANTQFEWELVQKKELPLFTSFTVHPVFRQLQYLPLLYAEKGDGLMVSDLPPSDYIKQLLQRGFDLPHLHLMEQPLEKHYNAVESWGASIMIKKWSESHDLSYAIPPWDIVKEVNSKAFSFLNSPALPGAQLLFSEKEAFHWLKQPGPKILKTCFGVSGRGHLVIDDSIPEEKIFLFLKSEWNEGRPVIAEPFVKRLLDFSTQWSIHNDQTIEFIGATLCENDVRGRYRNNRVGDDPVLFGSWLPYLNEHKTIALPILKKMAQMGYFGNVGIDAMVFEWKDNAVLHPVVEINARKTMGWAALQIQKRYFPFDIISLEYVSTEEAPQGLLPSFVRTEKNLVAFPKQLIFKKL